MNILARLGILVQAFAVRTGLSCIRGLGLAPLTKFVRHARIEHAVRMMLLLFGASKANPLPLQCTKAFNLHQLLWPSALPTRHQRLQQIPRHTQFLLLCSRRT